MIASTALTVWHTLGVTAIRFLPRFLSSGVYCDFCFTDEEMRCRKQAQQQLVRGKQMEEEVVCLPGSMGQKSVVRKASLRREHAQ